MRGEDGYLGARMEGLPNADKAPLRRCRDVEGSRGRLADRMRVPWLYVPKSNLHPDTAVLLAIKE